MSMLFSGGLFNVIPDSVVTQYEFDDDSDTTTATDSVGTNDATITGATYTTDAKVGSFAIDNDGTDDKTKSNNRVDLRSQGNTVEWGIAAYVKPQQVNNDWQVFAGISNPDNNVQFAHITEYGANGNGNYGAIIRQDAANEEIDTGVSIDTNSFIHAYLEVTDSTMFLYIDGSEVGSVQTPSGDSDIGSGHLVTGGVDDGSFLDGLDGNVIVDDYHAVNDSLTQSELDSLINRA